MKKLALVGLLVFVLAGCAFVRTQKENFDTCMADIECNAQAEAWRNKAEIVSTIAVTAVPVPGAAAAPKIIGYIALGLAGILGGAALKNKKEAVNVEKPN
jgi:hypothetical protein